MCDCVVLNVLFYLLIQVICCELLVINPTHEFTFIRKNPINGRVYVADDNVVREYYANMTFRTEYKIQTRRGSKIKLMEIFPTNTDTSILVCSTSSYNSTCHVVNSTNNGISDIVVSNDVNSLLRENDVIYSLNCGSFTSSENVYICVTVGDACTSYSYSTFVKIVDVSLINFTIDMLPDLGNCTHYLTKFDVLSSFKYKGESYFVAKATNGNRATLLRVNKTRTGETFVSVPLHFEGTMFPHPLHAKILAVNEYRHSFILFNKKGRYFTMLYVTMERVEKYIETVFNDLRSQMAIGSLEGIHRSVSVLEMNMTPWRYNMPETPIDAITVESRHGHIMAYYTYRTKDNKRVFYKLKLGSNSLNQRWKEIPNFGRDRVLDMWINEDQLFIATERKIMSLDLRSCDYILKEKCQRDLECTWCGDTPSATCKPKDACSNPIKIDTLIEYEIKSIKPNVGFSQGVVTIRGDNLDLTNNINVTIHGNHCEIISELTNDFGLEVRIPTLNKTITNTSLEVMINDNVTKSFPFTVTTYPYITQESGKTIRSGGTVLYLKVANYMHIDDSAFTTIEIVFLYNGTRVTSARLHSVDKGYTNEAFAVYTPPLLDYVDKDIQLALAAPTYHLIDKDIGYPVLYGGISNLTIRVHPDPVILGILDGDRIRERVTYSFSDKGGKIYFEGKNLQTVEPTDIKVTIEALAECTGVVIQRQVDERVSCDLPWPGRLFMSSVNYEIVVKIGRNLIYHPGVVRFLNDESPFATKSTRSTKTTKESKITIAMSRDKDSTPIRLEVIIPCVMVAVGFLGCVLMFFKFRKNRRRSPFRDTIDRDLPSVVSYRSNVGVFIGEPRPSFQGISAEVSSMDAFIPENFEDSAQLIINNMEDEGLILKKRDLNIDRLIGRGNFGSVYKGYFIKGEDRIEIAVKTLQREKPENMDITQFLKEAFVMKDFKHLNVMTLIGVCLDAGDMPLVVLPYMKHGDLLSYLQEEEHIPTVKDLVCFGLDIALGMEYLASLKFVHRDLAARNCMLDVNHRVKVADFGLSRDIYETSYYSTKSKGIKLPVKWMSIESLAEGVFNEKTDVWSYGVTLWELMTRGVRPYAAVDNWDIEAYLKSGRRLPQPLFCPANLYKLMSKCWSYEPDDRPTFTIVKEWITDLLDRVHHYLGDMEKSTDIENTYVNLSQGKQCKYENLHF